MRLYRNIPLNSCSYFPRNAVSCCPLYHGLSLFLDHPVQELPHLPAPADTHGKQSLQAPDLHPALAHGHDDPVAGAQGGDGDAGQLGLLLPVQVQQGVGGLVAGGVGGGGAGGAGGEVVGHRHAGVDEGEGGGVDERGQEGAVLREDVQGEGDGGVREEVRVQGRGKGF
ncbi:hypothetical protein VUR80DRAFT_10225 [Thermomyces stellatus]